MKNPFRNLLKILLIVTVCAVVVLMIFGMVLVMNWPWWVGIFIILLVAGLGFGLVFLRAIWCRRREQHFVRDMEEQDRARMKLLSKKERTELKDLQDRWRTAVEKLRTSHLKKTGNPLYALPWYMVIGDSGSGKTTSLSSARLASPFSDVSSVQGFAGTKQCEWYFFEQSIVIDTAGRYAIPVNGDRDKDEWQKFLALLLKYRRKEPLNGLIVTVAADRLLTAEKEELETYGKTIRQRIDELMRALGVRFPVYVLVTKCDLINGVSHFCANLPEKSLKQPMGIINQDLSTDVDAFMMRALSTIDERLRNLRLQLLHQAKTREADPALLLFPEEFVSLNAGLALFASSVFRQNPYQETPLLRGLFFSSGVQNGKPYSYFSETVGSLREEELLPGTNKGLFLHDFFAAVLPRDRTLLAPTRRSLEWRVLTGNLGLTSWVIVGVALCGLLSFSFVKNMKTIRDISQGYSRAATFGSDTRSGLVALDRFRKEILAVENRNRNWWIPRFGLNESLRIERELKNRYCRHFKEHFLIPFDGRLAMAITAMSTTTPDDLYGQYVVHVTRRINILKARLENSEMDALLGKPQPSYVSFMDSTDPVMNLEMRKVFGPLYLYYLLWRANPGETAIESAELQSWLKQLMNVKDGDLRWMTVWVDTQSGLPAVTLKDFWGGSLAASGEKWIAPSFTRRGKHSIDSLTAELRTALPEKSDIADHKVDFDGWYRSAAFESWHGFAADFPKGAERLRGGREWRQVASRMAGEQGPYFSLLNRVARELEPLATGGNVPDWLRQVYLFQATKVQGTLDTTGVLTRVAAKENRFVATIRRNLGREANAQPPPEQPSSMKSYQEYRKSLTAIIPATASRSLAFQLASQTFSEDPVTGASPMNTATAAVVRLKSSLTPEASEDVMTRLLQGPIQFLWTYVRRESGCHLQSLWEEQVLAPTLGMIPQQALPVTLGPDGLAWRFARGPAAPFLKGTMRGYSAKAALGGTVPLNNALFAFLGKGGQAQAVVMAMGKPQNFSIGIKGLPTDANAEASIKPHATRLELQCGGNSQILVNNNYPVSKTFNWSPEACSDVVLQIEVGDVVLSRYYMGQEGFPGFLKDMRGGRRTFSAREFPGEKKALERIGVKSITVNYRFMGSGPVLKQTATLSGQAPRSIAECWAQ